MSNFLFKPGQAVSVHGKNGIEDMLIIGNCIRDQNDVLHDYVGVPYSIGYKGSIAFFEHREIISIKDKGVVQEVYEH
jgi:hypothetical protein